MTPTASDATAVFRLIPDGSALSENVYKRQVTIGIWMFYVQHQFEDVYWERAEDWDFTAAALQGSSY
jgi:hypothetical protein